MRLNTKLRVAGQDAWQGPRDRAIAHPDEKLGVIREALARVDGESALFSRGRQADDEVGLVRVIAEQSRPLNPPQYGLMGNRLEATWI